MREGQARAVIALRRIDHVCLRVADLDEAARRWCIQFGFSERSELRTVDRAYLACGYEPYSLELWTSRGEPGHEHSAFELREGCTPDDAAAHLDALGVAYRRDEDDHLHLVDPEGYGVELVPFTPRDPYPDVGQTTATLPGFRARKLGHVNVLTGQLEAMRDFYRDALGMGVTDYLGSRGRVAAHQRRPPRDGAGRQDARAFPPLRARPRRLGTRCASPSTISASTAAGSAGGRCGTRSGRTCAATCASPRSTCFVELYCDMEVLDLPHTAREWRDDPRGSNLWGILPPRSYFRFDEAAVESERHQLEALGTPLPPL